MPALELLLICITYWNKTDTHPPLDSFIVSLLGLLVKAHPDPCHLGSAHMIWTMTDTGVHADKNFTSTPTFLVYIACKAQEWWVVPYTLPI